MNDILNQTNVDIILPNYNSFPYIEETINSIINQSFKNWNLFIIDDNSNIQTQKILDKYGENPKINIIRLKKNMRAGFCRNLAMRNSKAEYIAFIDSDDIWDNEKLSKQLIFMIKNKYDFTYTNYMAFKPGTHTKDVKKISPPKSFSFNSFIKNTSIATSSMIVKKSAIGNIKFSNTKICEDYFFKCQILKKIGYAYCLSENLMKYRVRKDHYKVIKLEIFTGFGI